MTSIIQSSLAMSPQSLSGVVSTSKALNNSLSPHLVADKQHSWASRRILLSSGTITLTNDIILPPDITKDDIEKLREIIATREYPFENFKGTTYDYRVLNVLSKRYEIRNYYEEVQVVEFDDSVEELDLSRCKLATLPTYLKRLTMYNCEIDYSLMREIAQHQRLERLEIASYDDDADPINFFGLPRSLKELDIHCQGGLTFNQVSGGSFGYFRYDCPYLWNLTLIFDSSPLTFPMWLADIFSQTVTSLGIDNYEEEYAETGMELISRFPHVSSLSANVIDFDVSLVLPEIETLALLFGWKTTRKLKPWTKLRWLQVTPIDDDDLDMLLDNSPNLKELSFIDELSDFSSLRGVYPSVEKIDVDVYWKDVNFNELMRVFPNLKRFLRGRMVNDDAYMQEQSITVTFGDYQQGVFDYSQSSFKKVKVSVLGSSHIGSRAIRLPKTIEQLDIYFEVGNVHLTFSHKDLFFVEGQFEYTSLEQYRGDLLAVLRRGDALFHNMLYKSQ